MNPRLLSLAAGSIGLLLAGCAAPGMFDDNFGGTEIPHTQERVTDERLKELAPHPDEYSEAMAAAGL